MTAGYKNIYGGRLLHRVIWEEAYGPIPENYVIHHKDGNKLNNDISNLECMPKSEHTKIHHKGQKRTDETRKNISESVMGRVPWNKGLQNCQKPYERTIEHKKKMSDACKKAWIKRKTRA